MSSVERRKLVEKDFSQYNQLLNKTMQNFRKTQMEDIKPNPDSPANKTFNGKALRDSFNLIDLIIP
jgi:hypothetical protein